MNWLIYGRSMIMLTLSMVRESAEYRALFRDSLAVASAGNPNEFRLKSA